MKKAYPGQILLTYSGKFEYLRIYQGSQLQTVKNGKCFGVL